MCLGRFVWSVSECSQESRAVKAPLELVQKVAVHKKAGIVLKQYFQPGRGAFRAALQTTMPKLLTNGQKSPRDEMRGDYRAGNAEDLEAKQGATAGIAQSGVRGIGRMGCDR